jgi:hypothetical protein
VNEREKGGRSFRLSPRDLTVKTPIRPTNNLVRISTSQRAIMESYVRVIIIINNVATFVLPAVFFQVNSEIFTVYHTSINNSMYDEPRFHGFWSILEMRSVYDVMCELVWYMVVGCPTSKLSCIHQICHEENVKRTSECVSVYTPPRFLWSIGTR